MAYFKDFPSTRARPAFDLSEGPKKSIRFYNEFHFGLTAPDLDLFFNRGQWPACYPSDKSNAVHGRETMPT